MNLKEIKELIQLMEDHGLTEVDLEKENTKIRLKKGGTGDIQMMSLSGTPMHSLAQSAPLSDPAVIPSPINSNVKEVLSPMVGTFYRQPAPGEKTFVEVGDTIKEGSVLCILEAMKLMNEVKSEYNGVIEEVLVENLQAVEFGQPLFRIRLNS